MAIKQSMKTSYFAINLLIFSGLLYLCYTMKPVPMKSVTKEGISNMNCCGGIEAGVHYSETDRKPPEYVRRCFKSKPVNGETVYTWNGFPCTNNDSSDCCNNEGECVATSRGGYCRSDSGDFIYRRRDGDTKSPYIKRSNDNILDVNDSRDMENYFYSRREEGEDRSLSPEMRRFMARRSKNEKFIEDAIVSKAANREKLRQEVQNRRDDEVKNYQIVYTITIIHLLILVVIAIVIRRTIIAKIQGYLDVVYIQYLKFSGKSI